MVPVKILFSILLTLSLFSCSQNIINKKNGSSIIIKENGNIMQQKTSTTIYLEGNYYIQSNGFIIQGDKIIFQYQGKQKTLPLSEVKQIITTDRWAGIWVSAYYSFIGGAVYSLLSVPNMSVAGSVLTGLWFALAIGSVPGFIIGDNKMYTIEKQM